MKHETQKAKTTVKTETGKVGWGGGSKLVNETDVETQMKTNMSKESTMHG